MADNVMAFWFIKIRVARKGSVLIQKFYAASFEKGLFLSVSFTDAKPHSKNFYFFVFPYKKYPMPQRVKSLFDSTKAKPLQTGSGDNFSSEKLSPDK